MLSLFPRTKTPLITLIILACSIVPARAERKNSYGASIDFMSGESNQAGQSNFSLESVKEGMKPFYSIYPSINLDSIGQHSTINLNYTFGAERFEMDPAFTTMSHTFNGSIGVQMGRRTRFRLSDTLNSAPEYSTIIALKGIVPSDQGFRFVFEPQLYKRSNISNNAGIGFDFDLTQKSFLTFSASGSFRNYDDAAKQSSLSDQYRIEGNLGFSHKQTARLTWSLKYNVWQNDYKNFPQTRSHAATFGLVHNIRPTLQLTLEAGPSFTEKQKAEKAYVNYIINASISKKFRSNSFFAGYSHYASDSTGLGSATESHQGTLGFSKSLSRNISLNFNSSAFKQMGRSGDTNNYWGVSGSAALSWQLGRHFVTTLGSSYMGYQGGNNYSNRRFYISFGYRSHGMRGREVS